MANYEAYSRTTYFKTTDKEKLKELVKKVGAELFEHRTNPELFAFGAEGAIMYYEDEDTEEQMEIFEELQALLPEGEAVIIQEVGHEKLRYLVGVAAVVTRDQVELLNLTDVAIAKAQEALKDTERDFITSY